jgi:hypothetical protein
MHVRLDYDYVYVGCFCTFLRINICHRCRMSHPFSLALSSTLHIDSRSDISILNTVNTLDRHF